MTTTQYIRFPSTNVSGTFTPSGLTIGGLVTEVTVNSATWTALPAVPLANRNAICILNTGASDIKINYDSGVAGYVGVPLPSGNQRFYDITQNIIVYAKSYSGTFSIVVEELA